MAKPPTRSIRQAQRLKSKFYAEVLQVPEKPFRQYLARRLGDFLPLADAENIADDACLLERGQLVQSQATLVVRSSWWRRVPSTVGRPFGRSAWSRVHRQRNRRSGWHARLRLMIWRGRANDDRGGRAG